jgi:hypothetical protein
LSSASILASLPRANAWILVAAKSSTEVVMAQFGMAAESPFATLNDAGSMSWGEMSEGAAGPNPSVHPQKGSVGVRTPNLLSTVWHTP